MFDHSNLSKLAIVFWARLETKNPGTKSDLLRFLKIAFPPTDEVDFIIPLGFFREKIMLDQKFIALGD